MGNEVMGNIGQENPNSIISKPDTSGVKEVEEMDEIEILKNKVKDITEDSFIPVSDSYGNILCVYSEDFKSLYGEERGSDVMFIVRGTIKRTDDKNIEMDIWDASLVHGKCGPKSKGKTALKKYFGK
jgi:hypothetical protein